MPDGLLHYRRRKLLADSNDPIEYIGGRRRPFWETMELKAARGDCYAISALEARFTYLQSGGRRGHYRHRAGRSR